MEQLKELGFVISATGGYLPLGTNRWTEYLIYKDGDIEVFFHIFPDEDPVEEFMTMEEYVKAVKILIDKAK